MKKRIISGLTAAGMVLLQVPVLVTTTLADTLSMEQAYFQVLDDIVQEYGICSDVWSYEHGLFYAELIDFDQDGKDELFLINKTEAGEYMNYNYESNYGSGMFPYELEVWEFDNGIASNLIRNQNTYIGEYHGEFALLRNDNGQYFLLSERGMNIGFSGYATYLEHGEFKTVEWDGSIHPENSTVSGKVNDSVSFEADSYENKDTSLFEAMDQFFLVSNATRVVDVINDCRFVAESDYSLYYELQANQYQSLGLDEILAKLPYTGDISKIKLTAEQAVAMAEEIDALTSGGEPVKVAIFDAGNGVPALWAAIVSEGASESYQYYWNGNRLETSEGICNGIEFVDGEPRIWSLYVTSGPIVGMSTYDIRYPFEHGMPSDTMDTYILNAGWEFYPETIYSGLRFTDFPRTSSLENDIISVIEHQLDELNLGEATINPSHFDKESYSDLDTESGYGYCLLINGESVPIDTNKTFMFGGDLGKLSLSYIPLIGEQEFTGNWAKGNETASLLRAYAEKAQFRYNFPEISKDSTVIDPILSELNLSGEVLEFYQLGENIFYVIYLENGVETGCIVKLVKIDGELCYIMLDETTTLLEEEALQSALTDYTVNSNILLNFQEIMDFSQEKEYLDYLIAALDNISGAALTDNGKSELVTFLQDSITNYATHILDSSGETGEITFRFITDLLTKSNSLFGSYGQLLEDKSEELNKSLQQCIRVIVRDLDPKNWTIFLNADLLDQLGENNLQVFLEDGQHGLEFSGEDLNLLLSTYGGVFVNVQQSGEGQYFITFADKDGNNIEKLEAPVKIFLPTDNEFATVMLEYAQGTENWGGQFNSSTNTIQFSTIHSGTYLIVDNSVEIHDVDEAYKTMIQFMVSKGFFEVDDDGNFHPNGTMSRYDFTKTIVSMFFALDRELKTAFPDISEDSPYYSYIASGESREIVAGYDDGLFYGDTIITEEMVFALIAQTLVDKKGYSYPNELESYLKMVSGGQNSTEWAQPGVALSVRDGIVLSDESINPTGDISRQDAAVYLYRLFMLLEEKQQVNFELAEKINVETEKNTEVTEKTSNIMILVGGATFLAGGSLWYLNDKKKKTD